MTSWTQQHQNNLPFPWLFQDFVPPSPFEINFASDVDCDNFENDHQPSLLIQSFSHPATHCNNSNDQQKGENINGLVKKKKLSRKARKRNSKNKSKKKNVALPLSGKDVNQSEFNAIFNTRENFILNNIKNEENRFVSYNNMSDYCMKLPKHYILSGTSWIDKITAYTSSVDGQISLFVLCVEADQEFYEKADELCNKLKEILQGEFSGLEICPKLFGSSKTRLALKDSDFDVFLDFGDQEKPEDLQNLIAEAVRKSKKDFSFQIITPIEARVPIVQCQSFNEPCCDISFERPLGVHNSSLIKFLISLDERIRQVILILKFWLKKKNILHFSKISSYGLANLAIFYFQQGQCPILPPVHILQKNSSNQEFVDGWNVSFAEDKTLLTGPRNYSSIFELVRGFVNFYRDFNFETYMICTYLGRALLKSDISVPKNLPSELGLYKKHLSENNSSGFMNKNPMWLQDPLIHDFNVARNATSILEFKRELYRASMIFNQEYEKSKLGDYNCLLFKKLFTRIDCIVPGTGKRGKGKKKKRMRNNRGKRSPVFQIV